MQGVGKFAGGSLIHFENSGYALALMVAVTRTEFLSKNPRPGTSPEPVSERRALSKKSPALHEVNRISAGRQY
jgi:hypothetical protein